MPQSWPSQWVMLFILFILSFIIVMTILFFMDTKVISKESSSNFSVSCLNWVW